MKVRSILALALGCGAVLPGGAGCASPVSVQSRPPAAAREADGGSAVVLDGDGSAVAVDGSGSTVAVDGSGGADGDGLYAAPGPPGAQDASADEGPPDAYSTSATGGPDGASDATPAACASANPSTLPIDSTGIVDPSCNTYGISGAWYCGVDAYGTADCPTSGPPYVAASPGPGMCLKGTTSTNQPSTRVARGLPTLARYAT